MVLVIIGVLMAVGLSRMGSRTTGSVRSVLDELEGTLAAAHKRCVATGKDVTVVVSGNWTAASPFMLAYGDATDASGGSVSASTILANGATDAEAFRYRATSADHLRAGIVVAGSTWWGTAATGNATLGSVVPFSDSSSAFASLVSDPGSDASNLSRMGSVTISGISKRFTSPFCLAVVGIRNGEPITAGPMGLIVVLNNGATVYKFYNPGAGEGSNQWRRL